MNKLMTSRKFLTLLLFANLALSSVLMPAASYKKAEFKVLDILKLSATDSEFKPNAVLAGQIQSEEIEKKIARLGLRRSNFKKYCRASWYGDYFHGRTTANMEIYDKNMLTAAHKSLPLGTFILVTNIETKKQAILRVNDRGPYIYGRELDLSEAAAKILGSHSKGVAKVKYEILLKA